MAVTKASRHANLMIASAGVRDDQRLGPGPGEPAIGKHAGPRLHRLAGGYPAIDGADVNPVHQRLWDHGGYP